MFNEICINEEMLPKYTYFKLHDPAAHKYNSTLEYRRDLVKRQITLCNMLKKKLHHFCNRSSPDDGPKSGRKYQGCIQLWTIHKSIPPEYDKSNTGIRTDPKENMQT